MSPRPRLSIVAALAYALAAVAPRATYEVTGRDVLDRVCSLVPLPSFGMRYGANPKATNGGGRSGAAAAKRASRKRRNVRLHPRGAA